MTRWRFLCAVLLAGLLAGAQAAEPPARPRIGLVLSGGGARGLAHVGVLRVLERERVPIDVIAGTSMGAIIGGLYASGMRAEDLERELLKIDWDALFANRVARRELSQRRKEQDYELSSALEIGLRDGEVRVPLGTVSSHGLESLLRRYTLPVRGVTSFDRLPIPFRAVATDMESGKAVVLEAGDLALALRSSMSVPGVFAPTEVDGRLLGDGGLVNNLPIDVARRMGADIVIAVNVGTPLAGRESLDTLVGVTAQMINILTEQNVQRSLATLTEQDLLITPPLGKLTAADFKHSADFIGLGRLHAEAVVLQMTRYAMDADTYSRWQAMHMRPPPAPPAVDFVRFEGVQLTHPERHAPALESQPGKAFDADAAERDARRLAATGDYTRVDYTLTRGPEGLDGIVFSLEEKSWGPNYFRLGLTLNTDFNGRSAFNLTVAHNRRWLDALGSEWRNVMRIGSEPAWFTEWYQPLNWASTLGRDWFLAPSAQIARSERITYVDPDGSESGRLRRTDMRLGVDLGRPWAELGEFRLGLYAQRLRDEPLLVRTGVVFDPDATDRRELGFRARAVIDQLDYVAFPQAGYRLVGEVAGGRLRSRREHGQNGFLRIEASGELAATWAETHTLNVFASTRLAGGTSSPGLGLYTLGGFQNLSGYEPGQVQGNYLVFGRVSYYHRLVPPALTRGFFAGASLESGNVWSRRDDASLGDLRYGGSLFLGADTGLGPLYLGVVYAPRGDAGVYLFLGRP